MGAEMSTFSSTFICSFNITKKQVFVRHILHTDEPPSGSPSEDRLSLGWTDSDYILEIANANLKGHEESDREIDRVSSVSIWAYTHDESRNENLVVEFNIIQQDLPFVDSSIAIELGKWLGKHFPNSLQISGELKCSVEEFLAVGSKPCFDSFTILGELTSEPVQLNGTYKFSDFEQVHI
jgi:hypothetical protein